MKKSSNATFPAFTICPSFHFAYKENILKNLSLTSDEYKNGYTSKTKLYPWDISLEKVTYDIAELIDDITIETVDSRHPKLRFDLNLWTFKIL